MSISYAIFLHAWKLYCVVRVWNQSIVWNYDFNFVLMSPVDIFSTCALQALSKWYSLIKFYWIYTVRIRPYWPKGPKKLHTWSHICWMLQTPTSYTATYPCGLKTQHHEYRANTKYVGNYLFTIIVTWLGACHQKNENSIETF